MKILCLGDIHTGSRWAPWPVEYELYDRSRWEPSPQQAFLNECWKHLLADAQKNRPDVIIFNGDILDGGNPRNVDVVSTRNDDQIGAAATLIAPLIKNARKGVFVTWGTGFHTGRCGENESELCNRLKIRYSPKIYLKTPAGILHATHHVSTSNHPMYEATALLRALYIKELELLRAFGKDDMPDVRCIVRSHRHRTLAIETEDKRLIVATAPWLLKPNYVWRVAAESESEIGYLWINATDKGFAVDKVRFQLPLPEVIRVD